MGFVDQAPRIRWMLERDPILREKAATQVYGTATCALEGSIAVTGSLVQGLRDRLGLISPGPAREVVAAMNTDSGLGLTGLEVDGGMTSNHLPMQPIDDVLDVPVERPLTPETVSLGAADAAGLAVGFRPELNGLRHHWHRAARWTPRSLNVTAPGSCVPGLKWWSEPCRR